MCESPSTDSDQTTPGHADDTIESLLARVREGNSAAVNQLVNECGPHILRVIRRRMSQRLRGRFDSQDFAQAVWATFFGHLSEISRFQQGQQLIQFLSRVASNKVIDAGRRAQVRNEQVVDNLSGGFERAQDRRLNMAEPTPSQHAVARESWDQLLENEQDEDRQLLELRRQGLTQLEIAERLGISERQVRRVLSRMSRKLATD